MQRATSVTEGEFITRMKCKCLVHAIRHKYLMGGAVGGMATSTIPTAGGTSTQRLKGDTSLGDGQPRDTALQKPLLLHWAMGRVEESLLKCSTTVMNLVLLHR